MDILLPHPSETASLLLAHARLGHADEVIEAIKAVPINSRGLRGTPLIEACRAEHATPLHVLTVQALLANKADVCLVDIWGATPLIHAALRCSVLPEQHLQRCWPAPGVKSRARRMTIGSSGSGSGRNRAGSYDFHAGLHDGASDGPVSVSHSSLPDDAAEIRQRKLLESIAKALAKLEPFAPGDDAAEEGMATNDESATDTKAGDAAGGPATPDRSKRMSKRKSMSASAAAASVVAAAGSASSGYTSSGDGLSAHSNSLTSPGGDLAGSLCRPRFASDGTNRHIQLVTLLLNSTSASSSSPVAGSSGGSDGAAAKGSRASTSSAAAIAAAAPSAASSSASSSPSIGVSSVLARTRNGVSAAMILAASPSPDAVAILEWVLEKACEEAARLDAAASAAGAAGGVSAAGGATAGPATTAAGAPAGPASSELLWQPDAAGANIVHYCAYAANADALRLLMRPGVCDEARLRSMIACPDAFGRTPLDVLSLYSEETILAAPRVKALQRGNLWSEVPFDSRRREFRALLTTLL